MDMKIEHIEAIALRIPFTAGGKSDVGAWGDKDLKTVDSLVVKVTTDSGVVGWGESFGFTSIPAVKVAIEQIIAPLCIGRDAAQIGNLMLELQKKLHSSDAAAPSCSACPRSISLFGTLAAKWPDSRYIDCWAAATPRHSTATPA
jgi:L-alanine-DL-glutamate epimerase-like enolase superfamily enzyme